jgi:hypothetical protein
MYNGILDKAGATLSRVLLGMEMAARGVYIYQSETPPEGLKRLRI